MAKPTKSFVDETELAWIWSGAETRSLGSGKRVVRVRAGVKKGYVRLYDRHLRKNPVVMLEEEFEAIRLTDTETGGES